MAGRRAIAGGVCLALVAAACSDDKTPPASSSERATGDDLLADVEVSRGPHSTISAVIEAQTSKDAVVSVEVDADEGSVESPPPTKAGTSHTVPVVGMRAATTYSLRVTAAATDGSEDSAEIEWTTGALPDDLPPLTVDVADADAVAPGVTLFTATLGGGDAPPEVEKTGYLLAVDGEGEVVWYYATGPSFMEVSQTAQGTLLVQLGQTTIREIDVLGNTVRSFATRVAADLGTDLGGHALTTPDSEPLAVESSHHELQQLDSGNIITLSTELVRLDDATARGLCPADPETDIISDTVVELSSAGEVVQEWPLTAVYDPVERPGTEMCVEPNPVAPPNWFYPDAAGLRDWTHGNAVVVDEESNSMLVSLRHLDAIAALRYHDDVGGPAGELLWELGPQGTLELAGEGDWPYHPHAPELHDDGTLLVYDNGNGRPGTGEGADPAYTRVVLYDIDEEAGTVTQVWEHRDTAADDRPVFAPFVGDADRLENGNVLIDHGGLSDADGIVYTRLLEVVPGPAPDGSEDKIVFDLTVGDGQQGWASYRADRLPSLYGMGSPAG
jgi:Arylsulfotransferase (ASST)/Arylsulfotransferase Ig-like domain